MSFREVTGPNGTGRALISQPGERDGELLHDLQIVERGHPCAQGAVHARCRVEIGCVKAALEAVRKQVLGWLDTQVRVRVLPDAGGGWAVVLVAPVYRAAGLPATSRMRIVDAAGEVWEPAGLDRVVGVPQRSPDGSALAGHAVQEGRVHAWAAWPATRRVEVAASQSLAGPVESPWLLSWAGPHRLVVGVPAGQEPSPVPALGGDEWPWVFEAAPRSRVALQPREDDVVPQGLRCVDLRDGAVREVPVAVRPYRWVRASADGTRVGAYAGPAVPGAGAQGIVALAPSTADAGGRERVIDAAGVAAECGWLGDGRMVGLMGAEGAGGWALRVLDPAGEAVLARVRLPVHAGADRQVVAVLADAAWWWLADAGGDGLVSVEVASGQVARWRPAGGERPHAWVVVHSAPARVVAVGSDGRGNEVVLLLEGEPDAAGQGGRLRVRHRVALPAGSQCLGVKDWGSGQVLVAGESGEVGVFEAATAATRRVGRRASVRRIDLGDPGGDGEMAVGLYLPSGPVAATVVSLAPVPSTPGRGGGTEPPVMPLGSLEAWSHSGLLLRLGFAVADVTMRVPWWPELPDEQIRPAVAARIAAAVTATGLGEHVDVGALAVRGHSFAASLALIALADTGLFRTAIVVSGGYCRSMMPLGFQDEHRMLWEAQTVYRDFDAVLSAPRITRPVLILHGTDDSHPATPVAGAQVLFQALTALGTPARLVLLPGEGHTFLTREAVSAAVTEQAVWLRRWANHSETAPQAPGVLG